MEACKVNGHNGNIPYWKLSHLTLRNIKKTLKHRNLHNIYISLVFENLKINLNFYEFCS